MTNNLHHCVRILTVVCLCMLSNGAGAISLSDLNAGGSILVGAKLFFNWSVSTFVMGSGIADITQIDVTGDNSDPLNPGLVFSAPSVFGTQLPNPGNSSASVVYGFFVSTVSSDPLITGNSLQTEDFAIDASSGTGLIQVSEEVRRLDGTVLGDKLVDVDFDDQPGTGDPDHFDEISFAPQSIVVVSAGAGILGPNLNDAVFLTQWSHHFS